MAQGGPGRGASLCPGVSAAPGPLPEHLSLALRLLLSGPLCGLNLMSFSSFPRWRREPGLPALRPFLTHTGGACLSFPGPWGHPCRPVFCHLVTATLSRILSIFCRECWGRGLRGLQGCELANGTISSIFPGTTSCSGRCSGKGTQSFSSPFAYETSMPPRRETQLREQALPGAWGVVLE